MLDVTIDIAEAQRMIDRATDEAKLTRAIADAVADDLVLPALAKSPAQSHKKMQFVSAKQRRAFFAMLRDGVIDVPYRRTGDYGRSFVKQPDSTGMTLASNLAYAPYVRGPGQAAYHKGNWTDLETLAQELEPQAEGIAEDVIVKEIAGP